MTVNARFKKIVSRLNSYASAVVWMSAGNT